MAVKPIPEGYHTVTPFVSVYGAARVLDFLRVALGATERYRLNQPDGNVMHAEVQIGDSIVMIGETMEGDSPMPASLYLYVPDPDATYRAALVAGGESIMEPEDQFWGDRLAGVKDPTGNKWWFAVHIEDVPEEEIAR